MCITSCCFIGHRNINQTEELERQLYTTIENLILNDNAATFLFGSKSAFNSLCYETVTKLKIKYPHIKRIYVRAEFPDIDDNYLSYLLERYEDTYFPETAIGAGKAVYLKRNYEMINKSDFCVFYYNKDCLPDKRKSGTVKALEFAVKNSKNIIILPHAPSP